MFEALSELVISFDCFNIARASSSVRGRLLFRHIPSVLLEPLKKNRSGLDNCAAIMGLHASEKRALHFSTKIALGFLFVCFGDWFHRGLPLARSPKGGETERRKVVNRAPVARSRVRPDGVGLLGVIYFYFLQPNALDRRRPTNTDRSGTRPRSNAAAVGHPSVAACPFFSIFLPKPFCLASI